MKLWYLPIILSVTACTTTDALDARDVTRDSIFRQIEAVSWRETTDLALMQETVFILRLQSRAAANKGDFESALGHIEQARKMLNDYQPVLEKLQKIGSIKTELESWNLRTTTE